MTTINPTWLEQAVMQSLQQNCPKGYHINPKAHYPIAKSLIRTQGICPCTHTEWNEQTPLQDKLCPCSTFLQTGECHCTLYQPNPTTQDMD